VPSFAYTARNAGGEKVSGVADALTAAALADQLAGLGIVALDIQPAAPPGPGSDLLRRLRPGVDGVVLAWRGRRATFLPQVWESLAEPRDFIAALKRKASYPGLEKSVSMISCRQPVAS